MSTFDPDVNCDLTTDLKAFYKLEEASGARFDSITPGTGNAASFASANSEYLNVASNASLQTGDIDFTIALWVYFVDKLTVPIIVSKWAALSADEEWILVYADGPDRLIFSVRNAAATATIDRAANSFGSPPNGTFMFVVCWHDSVNDTVNIQVNDGPVDSSEHTGGVNIGVEDVRIARDGRNILFLNGRVDEFGFWKRVLTAHERTDLYNSGNGIPSNVLGSGIQTSLISYWDLDETSGTRVDAIGSNDFTDNNTVTSAAGVSVGNSLADNNTVTQAVGKVGNAGQFTAANSEFLSIADNPDLSMGDIDFTVAAWVRLDTKPGRMNIVAKATFTGSQREYRLLLETTDRYHFQVDPDGLGLSDGRVNADSFGSPPTGEFHFVVGWHDSVANTVNIQVNNGPVDSVAHTTGVLDGTASLIIGARDEGGDSFFDGRIDEVGIWKRVLTSQERTDLYNSGVGNTFDREATCVISRKSDMFLVFD